MLFKCQEDSYLTEFTTKVLKCEEAVAPIIEYGKVTKFRGYQITLENTILFPVGGGQPHDTGYLNEVEVLQVLRKGEEARHFTNEPIEVGTVVTQKLNWERRFDHMQQHTGQHLLSAILDKDKFQTTSWWLGEEESYVEINCVKISNDIIDKVEKVCNELIRKAVPVIVKICKINDPGLCEAHTRGLPKDCTDTLRIINIENIDENLCCGTHVKNLCELQMIKLLGCEPGKKGKTNLKFVVGNRVTKLFQQMLDREKTLTALLKNEPNKHEELVEKLQKNVKISNKNLQNVLMELAQYEVEKVKKAKLKPKFIFYYKKEATPEFYRIICKELESENLFMCMISQDQDKPKEGQILIQGPQHYCDVLGPKIMEFLKGKGAFTNGKFQGKAGDLSGVKKCKTYISDYFDIIHAF